MCEDISKVQVYKQPFLYAKYMHNKITCLNALLLFGEKVNCKAPWNTSCVFHVSDVAWFCRQMWFMPCATIINLIAHSRQSLVWFPNPSTYKHIRAEERKVWGTMPLHRHWKSVTTLAKPLQLATLASQIKRSKWPAFCEYGLYTCILWHTCLPTNLALINGLLVSEYVSEAKTRPLCLKSCESQLTEIFLRQIAGREWWKITKQA